MPIKCYYLSECNQIWNILYDKTESHHITENVWKVAIKTITWLWTKSFIIHTVTFRGIVNVEKYLVTFFRRQVSFGSFCTFLSSCFCRQWPVISWYWKGFVFIYYWKLSRNCITAIKILCMSTILQSHSWFYGDV